MTDITLQTLEPKVAELSSKDLKNLKKQVLKQAYDMEINIKGRKNSQNLQFINPEQQVINRPEGGLHSSRSLQLLPSYSPNHRELQKQILKESYDSQIQRNNDLKTKEKLKLSEEKDVLNELNKYQSQLDLQQKKAKQEYAQFLTSEITRKKEMQTQIKREELIKEANRLNRRKGLLNKEHSFKEYFSSLNKYRDNVSTDYLSYLNQAKLREQEKKITDKEMMERQRRLIEEQANEQRRRNSERKQELRKVLEQQIMDNRSFKASELHQFKNRGYVKSETNVYNPISNPIDYQLDLSNKYVVQQLLQKKPLQ